MPVLPTVARALLAPIFVNSGSVALRHPAPLVTRVEPFTAKLTSAVPALPQDAATLVRINGAVQLAGGTLLSAGKYPRLAALALIGSLIPTTYAGHAFWKEDDPTARSAQRTQFEKNLAIMGGLLLLARDGGRKS